MTHVLNPHVQSASISDKIHPMLGFILVDVLKVKSSLPSGLELPPDKDHSMFSMTICRVVEKGKGTMTLSGEFVDMDEVEVGDLVCYRTNTPIIPIEFDALLAGGMGNVKAKRVLVEYEHLIARLDSDAINSLEE